MRHLLAILTTILACTSLSAQWTFDPQDTTLRFLCPECPVQCKELTVGPRMFHLGEAVAVDLVYLDYTSTPVLVANGVPLDGTDTTNYQAFLWFISNVYGWVEMTVYLPDMTYTYVVSTMSAYEAERRRGW